MKRTRVLLADHHSVLTDCLTHLLRPEFEVVGVACDGTAMVEMAKQHKPDVIVADTSLPQLNGIDAARIVRKMLRSTKILFLTMHSDHFLVAEAFRAGALGFVLKATGAQEFLNALRAVARGETYITPALTGDVISALMTIGPRERHGDDPLTVRQRQLLQLVAEGKTMKEAAALMDISTRTAESHKYEIMRRLGVETTANLIRHALELKLV
jgi:DNA-binding NarL/FixJ family response regulator